MNNVNEIQNDGDYEKLVTITHILTFKWPVFTYTNLQKNTPRNSFYIFRQQTNLLHFLLHYLFYFPQNTIYFIILSFSGQIICFSLMKHYNWKYQPICLKANNCTYRSITCAKGSFRAICVILTRWLYVEQDPMIFFSLSSTGQCG